MSVLQRVPGLQETYVDSAAVQTTPGHHDSNSLLLIKPCYQYIVIQPERAMNIQVMLAQYEQTFYLYN